MEIRSVEPPAAASRHTALVYDGDLRSQMPVLADFLMDGLRRRRRCLVLGTAATVALVDEGLAARGVDVRAEQQRGALVFTSDRPYLHAPFEPGG
ncbi:MAG: MEDS domain-containing protein [Vicinamibacterales bacterium]